MATLHINEKVCPRYIHRERERMRRREEERDALLKKPSGLCVITGTIEKKIPS